MAVLAVTLLAVSALVAGAFAGAARTAGQADPATTRTVVVQPGDTLWDIATAALPSADPRSTIDAIEDLNGLDAADGVTPGLHLVVPAD